MATTASDSTSLQVHMLVKTSNLHKILKATSAAQVWCTPKTIDGRPDTNWRLLWLEHGIDLQTALISSAKLPELVGITRVRGRFAIRISKANFAAAWSIVNPGLQQPEMIDGNSTWRIESLPFGVTKDMLTAWSKHHSWSIRPLRAVGPRGWIVISATSPPSPQMFFNSSPVVIREVAPRQIPVNPIIAGPKASKPAIGDDTGRIIPLREDPWAGWKGLTPARSSMVQPAQNTQGIVGPTEAKFAAQEQRMEKLESAIQQLQESQSKQQDAFQQLHGEVKANEIETRKHMDKRMDQIKMELDGSFTKALAAQSSSFEKGMQDLKKLLLAAPKRTRETSEDDHMEG